MLVEGETAFTRQSGSDLCPLRSSHYRGFRPDYAAGRQRMVYPLWIYLAHPTGNRCRRRGVRSMRPGQGQTRLDRGEQTMAHEPRTYATAPACCGHREQPGVTQISEALDWSHQATTPDQAYIEAVLTTLAVTGSSLLHVGVGNSQLAQRFA